MKVFKQIAFIGLMLFLGSIFAPGALAQDDGGCGGVGGFSDGIGCVGQIRDDSGIPERGKDDIAGLILDAIKILLSIVGVIALAAIIWGGVMYITAAGNDQRIEQAKRVIMYAIIGLIVIGLAAVIVNVVLEDIVGIGGGGGGDGEGAPPGGP